MAGWGGGRHAGLCVVGRPPARVPLCPVGADTCPSWEAVETPSLEGVVWELKSGEKLGACERGNLRDGSTSRCGGKREGRC